jgi:hypothetical protein
LDPVILVGVILFFAAGFALVASSTHLPGCCYALGHLPPTLSALPGLDLPAAVGLCVDFTC